MDKSWTEEEKAECQTLFNNVRNFIGKEIDEILFYLDVEDLDFNEQENAYGKSLLNGVELILNQEKYYLGNYFFSTHYNGLNLIKGNLTDFEFIDNKIPKHYSSKILKSKIIEAKIFWHKAFVGNYFVPIEIVFETQSDYILFSSIEVNFGKVNTELTDELLIIENKQNAQKLYLAEFGIKNNGRKCFKNIEEIKIAEKEFVS